MNQNASASGASEQAKIKRRRHRKPGKDMVYRCLVCEDVALNYNFTVITCESCKAFFRRNVDTPVSKCAAVLLAFPSRGSFYSLPFHYCVEPISLSESLFMQSHKGDEEALPSLPT